MVKIFAAAVLLRQVTWVVQSVRIASPVGPSCAVVNLSCTIHVLKSAWRQISVRPVSADSRVVWIKYIDVSENVSVSAVLYGVSDKLTALLLFCFFYLWRLKWMYIVYSQLVPHREKFSCIRKIILLILCRETVVVWCENRKVHLNSVCSKMQSFY